MPDLDAITVALAARFAPAAVTPPVGYANIRSSTGNAPNTIDALPAVIVFPESGEFPIQSSGKRSAVSQFSVVFYYSQTMDLSRDTVALRKWASVLVDQLRLSAQLGGIVDRAQLKSWKIGLMQTYAGDAYTGIEMAVEIVTDESWAAVA